MNKPFRKLKFNIYDLPPETDILDQYPELSRYKVFTASKAPQKNLLLRYLIFLLDPNSDLLKEIKELKTRKIKAAELAGFTQQNDYLQEIFDLHDETTVKMMECLLTQVYHNRKYTEWQTLTQELDEYTRLRMEPITTKSRLKNKDEENPEDIYVFKAASEKTKIRVQCEEIHRMLDAVEKEIFGDNDDIKTLALKSRFVSPESFAGVLRQAS